jgi:hypothetical protein
VCFASTTARRHHASPTSKPHSRLSPLSMTTSPRSLCRASLNLMCTASVHSVHPSRPLPDPSTPLTPTDGASPEFIHQIHFMNELARNPSRRPAVSDPCQTAACSPPARFTRLPTSPSLYPFNNSDLTLNPVYAQITFTKKNAPLSARTHSRRR